MTRVEEIREQLQIIEDQLKYTKLEVLIKNCNRTKKILQNELLKLEEYDRPGNKF